jgi:hypothetical protein
MFGQDGNRWDVTCTSPRMSILLSYRENHGPLGSRLLLSAASVIKSTASSSQKKKAMTLGQALSRSPQPVAVRRSQVWI